MDIEWIKTKEILYMYNDRGTKELLIDFKNQLLNISNSYALFYKEKWKYLWQTCRCVGQMLHRILTRNCQKGIRPQSAECHCPTGFNKECLVKHALNIHKNAMEIGEMQYNGQIQEKVAEQLFQINEILNFPARMLTNCWFVTRQEKNSHEISRPPFSWSTRAGWRQTSWQRWYYCTVCQDSYVLGTKADVNCKQKEKENSHKNNWKNKNQNNLSDEEKAKQDSSSRRKLDAPDQWKDCLENWHYKNCQWMPMTPLLYPILHQLKAGVTKAK